MWSSVSGISSPRVSPAKTVEGAIGAVAIALVVALGCRWVFFPELGRREVVGLAVAVSLLAQLGDLGESALKRAFGAKDSGWIIPGHGGILDRLDSLVFPVVFAITGLLMWWRGRRARRRLAELSTSGQEELVAAE